MVTIPLQIIILDNNASLIVEAVRRALIVGMTVNNCRCDFAIRNNEILSLKIQQKNPHYILLY